MKTLTAPRTLPITPVVYIDRYNAEKFAGTDGETTSRLVEASENAMKRAVGYTWGNTHVYITNTAGRPVLQVQWSGDYITFWFVATGVSVGGFEQSKMTKAQMIELIDKAETHTRCQSCEKFVPHDKVKHYSFAGGVCPKCYDPKKHLPPDTSGD